MTIRITMTGADGAEHGSAVATSSRLIVFPDGIARHITLTNREWDVADWLESAAGWPPDVLAEESYQHAHVFWFIDTFNEASGRGALDHCEFRHAGATHERARFEHQLRRSFRSMIRVNMARASGIDLPVNDTE